MATICMSYNLILYRANYFVLREHFVFNILCRTCRHLCAGFSEGVVLTSVFDFPPTVPFFLSVFCHHCITYAIDNFMFLCDVCHTCVGVFRSTFPVHYIVRTALIKALEQTTNNLIVPFGTGNWATIFLTLLAVSLLINQFKIKLNYL